MKVEHVFAQVCPPKGGDQGVTVEGCFIVDGNRVTMTDRERQANIDDEGGRWSREIPPSCTPQRIAAQMTKEPRIKFRGGERASGFWAPASYEPLKFA